MFHLLESLDIETANQELGMYKDGKAVHKIHVQDNTSGNGLDKAAEKKPL